MLGVRGPDTQEYFTFYAPKDICPDLIADLAATSGGSYQADSCHCVILPGVRSVSCLSENTNFCV
jgi:hypothetical protein